MSALSVGLPKLEVHVKLLEQIQLRDPVLIGGLPGIGYVAKLATDYLVQQLKAQLFGQIYSQFFPPYVMINKDGTVDIMKNELYYYRSTNSDIDLVIFTGNAQAVTPEGQYRIAEEVLKVGKDLGVKKLFALAAYATDRHVEKPNVYGAATDMDLVEELKGRGVIPMEDGSISGINGLLFGLCKLWSISGLCLLGETHAFASPGGRSLVDAKSSQAVLEVLTRMLGITIDMAPLETQAKATEEFIQRLETMERQVVEEMTRKTGRREEKYTV